MSWTGWAPVAAVLLGAGWGSNQFTPMLLVYRHTLGLGTGTLEAMFGFYALGLIPGLLVSGALSDARGRRPVVVSAAALSLAGSLALVMADDGIGWLYAGRLLAGLSSGAAFSAGTAWLRELSRPPFGTAAEEQTARRAAVAMTTGLALGPLVSGLLAQWAPSPAVVPYLPHLVLMIVVLAAVPWAPETLRNGAAGAVRRALPAVRDHRFRGIVVPMAPWVFGAPVIGFALLPTVVGAEHAADGIALTATITMLCALAGVLVQPLGRRLDGRTTGNRAATIGLGIAAVGLALAALTAQAHQTWLLVPSAIVLGGAYGVCLVAGLVEVQRLADETALAGVTAVYYSLMYLGFAAPYLLALAAHLAPYPVLLTVTAGLALLTAARVSRHGSRRRPAD